MADFDIDKLSKQMSSKNIKENSVAWVLTVEGKIGEELKEQLSILGIYSSAKNALRAANNFTTETSKVLKINETEVIISDRCLEITFKISCFQIDKGTSSSDFTEEELTDKAEMTNSDMDYFEKLGRAVLEAGLDPNKLTEDDFKRLGFYDTDSDEKAND